MWGQSCSVALHVPEWLRHARVSLGVVAAVVASPPWVNKQDKLACNPHRYSISHKVRNPFDT